MARPQSLDPGKDAGMRRQMVFLLLTTLLALLGVTPTAFATQPATGVVQDYADLNGHCPNPEGIAIDPNGNAYASSAPHVFGGTGPATICVISTSGQIRELPIAPGAAGVTNLLGMLFEQSQGLYVTDLANGSTPNGRLLRVDPATGSVTTGATGFAAANA